MIKPRWCIGILFFVFLVERARYHIWLHVHHMSRGGVCVFFFWGFAWKVGLGSCGHIPFVTHRTQHLFIVRVGHFSLYSLAFHFNLSTLKNSIFSICTCPPSSLIVPWFLFLFFVVVSISILCDIFTWLFRFCQ